MTVQRVILLIWQPNSIFQVPDHGFKAMTNSEKEPAKLIAFIFLAIDVIALLFVGYICAENDALHYRFYAVDTKKVSCLTVKEDMLLQGVASGTVSVPKGTVIVPAYIFPDRIGFYYTVSGGKEKLFTAKPECFKEYGELEKLLKDADEKARENSAKVFWNDFLKFAAAGLILFGVFFPVTVLLSKKRLYVLLAVIETVMLLCIIFIIPSLFLYH